MKFSSAPWYGGSFENNVRTAKKYGFRAVEILGWKDIDVDAAAEVLHETGMENSMLLLASRDAKLNEKVFWSHGIVWDDTAPFLVEALSETAEAAHKMGTKNIVLTSGNAREGVSPEAQHEAMIKNLSAAAPVCEELGVTLCLEPLNVIVDHPGHFLTTSAEAFDVVKAVNSPNVKVLFDIYHQQVTEGNVIRNITENIEHIAHFHIADNPGRAQPGTGELNYSKIFEAIYKTGFDGWLAFECSSTVPVEELCPAMHELIAPFED